VLAPGARERLIGVLERAREHGFVGPGPVEFHVEHAETLVAAVDGGFAGRFLDLGSGGGLPGLVLFLAWPEATGTLLDAQRRRCVFLERVLVELGVSERGEVACGRAEDLARRRELRHGYDLVVARGFGPPATTAECAIGFLGAGGRLVVSEPRGEATGGRWPRDGLTKLGLRGPEIRGSDDARFAILRLEERAADRWPRRTGVPGKRPLWRAG
jgi:16S rRNA (guanine527-N7)-methyltransferase